MAIDGALTSPPLRIQHKILKCSIAQRGGGLQ